MGPVLSAFTSIIESIETETGISIVSRSAAKEAGTAVRIGARVGYAAARAELANIKKQIIKRTI